MADGPVADAPVADGPAADGPVVDGAAVDGAAPDGRAADASSPDAMVVTADAGTLGRAVVSWTMHRAGSPMTCADLGANEAWIQLRSATDGAVAASAWVPCTAGLAEIDVGPGWYRPQLTFIAAPPSFASVGGTYSSTAYFVAGPGDVVPMPVVIEYFIEPVDQLTMLYDAAVAHHAMYGTFAAAPAIVPQPPLGTCCAQPDQICDPDPARWTDPTWVALGFAITTRGRASYGYTLIPGGFRARAYTDHDCDGVYGTWTIEGILDASGAITTTGVSDNGFPLE